MPTCADTDKPDSHALAEASSHPYPPDCAAHEAVFLRALLASRHGIIGCMDTVHVTSG